MYKILFISQKNSEKLQRTRVQTLKYRIYASPWELELLLFSVMEWWVGTQRHGLFSEGTPPLGTETHEWALRWNRCHTTCVSRLGYHTVSFSILNLRYYSRQFLIHYFLCAIISTYYSSESWRWTDRAHSAVLRTMSTFSISIRFSSVKLHRCRKARCLETVEWNHRLSWDVV